MANKKDYQFKRQVASSHYFNLEYDSKARWISYWYQISEVLKKRPKTILEIGVGNGTVSSYLKKIGLDVTTCDFDRNLKPDVVADIRNLPFESRSFDLILCAEVLEHIAFFDFQNGLNEIKRVTNKWAVLTLPHFSLTNLYFGAKIIPFVSKKELSFKVDIPIKHKFLGEHYWEIGKKNYPLGKIKDIIRESGFKIEKCFYPKENPRHQLFVLEK